MHGHELRGEIAGGKGNTKWREAKGENWDNRNSIISKVYLKNNIKVEVPLYFVCHTWVSPLE